MRYNLILLAIASLVLFATVAFKHYMGGVLKVKPEEINAAQKYKIGIRKKNIMLFSVRKVVKDMDAHYESFKNDFEASDNRCVKALHQKTEGLPKDEAVLLIIKDFMDYVANHETILTEKERISVAYQDVNPECNEQLRLVFEIISDDNYLLTRVENYNPFYDCVCE